MDTGGDDPGGGKRPIPPGFKKSNKMAHSPPLMGCRDNLTDSENSSCNAVTTEEVVSRDTQIGMENLDIDSDMLPLSVRISGPSLQTGPVESSAMVGASKKRSREEISDLEARKAPLKRSNSVGDSFSIDLANAEDTFQKFLKALMNLSSWIDVQQKDKKLSKTQAQVADQIVSSIRLYGTQLKMESCELQGRLLGRQDMFEAVREEMGKKEVEKAEMLTFAEIIKKRNTGGLQEDTRSGLSKITGIRRNVQPARKVVIIKKEGQDSEEVKKKVKEVCNPRQLGINVRRMNKIKNGVAIEVDSDRSLDKLMNCQEVVDAGLDIDKPKLRNPSIMIYDIPREFNDEQIIEEIFVRNINEGDMEWDKFKDEFKMKHKYGDKGSDRDRRSINAVFVVPIEIRNLLRSRDRIFIGWNSCRVKDFIDVVRCFKCHLYGHVSKYCRSKPICPLCFGEHETRDCKAKKEDYKNDCVACHRVGRLCDPHDPRDRWCPTYVKAAEDSVKKTDYGRE